MTCASIKPLSTKQGKNMANKNKTQIGFFVTQAVKTKLQSLSLEKGRTMSAQLTEMINRDYKKMISAQLRADQSNALSNGGKMNFKKCPFCGKKETVRIQTASEYVYESWGALLDTNEQYQVVCNATTPIGPGGCGASTGFFDSEEKAVESWQTRA